VVSVRSASFLEILLDLAALVVSLDLRLDAALDDAGAKPSWGGAADLAPEDDLHLVGAPERQLIGQQLLKPGAAGAVAGRSNTRVSESSIWRTDSA
jgi:hypothetical protein